jgi:hypothetical protein
VKITVKAAEQAIRNHQSFDAGNLTGRGIYVLTPLHEVPPLLREGQEARMAAYMATGERNAPASAPVYVVCSYGVPVAYVAVSGEVVTADLRSDQKTQTTMRHQALALRALKAR